MWKTNFARIPEPTPINKSVETVTIMVITKMTSCSAPILYVLKNSFGEARRYPTAISNAANAELGIISITGMNSNMATNKKNPWKKFDQRVRAPKLTLAELRATSEIIGKPPSKPERALPAPNAERSLLKLDCLLYGSRPSTAFTVSNDSRLLMNKNMITYFQKTPVPIASKRAD